MNGQSYISPETAKLIWLCVGVLIGGCIFAALARGAINLLGPDPVQKCDEAIMGTLKAPSTYKRISHYEIGRNQFRISYDASNAFGVPIRGSGTCDLSDYYNRWQPDYAL